MSDPDRSGAAEPTGEPGGERDELSDTELLERVRAGDDAAFGALYARHASAVRAYAARHGAVGPDVDDLAAEAFFRVLQTVRKGSGPVRHARAYLITVTRRIAAEWAVRRREVTLTDEDLPVAEPQVDRVERGLITTAFTSLPERWRAVLWRVEVQGERPAVVARSFGLSANATAALARRARHGLRAAYLQAHLSTSGSSAGCRGITEKLGAYTAGGLRGSETRRVRAHLAGCSDCRTLQAELSEVCSGLRCHAALLLVPAGITGLLSQIGGAGGTGKVVALQASAITMRTKIGVAAASVSAVGVIGLGAGPLLGADRAELGLEGRHEVIATAPLTSGHQGADGVPTSAPDTDGARDGLARRGVRPAEGPPTRLERQPTSQPDTRQPVSDPPPNDRPDSAETAKQPRREPQAREVRAPDIGNGRTVTAPPEPPSEIEQPVLTSEPFVPPPPPLIDAEEPPCSDLPDPEPVRPPDYTHPTESNDVSPYAGVSSPSVAG